MIIADHTLAAGPGIHSIVVIYVRVRVFIQLPLFMLDVKAFIQFLPLYGWDRASDGRQAAPHASGCNPSAGRATAHPRAAAVASLFLFDERNHSG